MPYRRGMRPVLFALAASLGACAGSSTPPPPSRAPSGDAPAPIVKSETAMTTFDDDVAFLRAHGDVIVLERGGARIALSPKYQGRVMTSAVGGDAPSLGWINRSF